ncbi:MAG: hypothetical protein SPJ68_05400 [Arcanobacterium sp.]|nr:hypothetical protein [Arcanobacterium sp.]
MDDFSLLVSRAVSVWRVSSGVSVVELAGVLHVSPSSLYSKLNGSRRWNASDLRALRGLGVKLPSVGGGAGR